MVQEPARSPIPFRQLDMFRVASCLPIVLLAAALGSAQEPAEQDSLEFHVDRLETELLPFAATDSPKAVAGRERTAAAIERWAARLARYEGATEPPQVHEVIERLTAAKERVDRVTESVLAERTRFAAIPADARKSQARAWLQAMSKLLDLSGRLRYVLVDAADFAAFRFASQPEQREKLIDFFTTHRSSIGAVVMAAALFDPPAKTPNGAVPATPSVKAKLLALIAVSGQMDLLPEVAEFLQAPSTSPELVLAAAETVRELGLPQEPRPNQDRTLPPPPITASRLYEVLAQLPSGLPSEAEARRQALLSWLEVRRKEGLAEASYRLGAFDVQPGDWLLMRNPSPYNLFTDLSPGLFTHVGLVTLEQGSDGIRRMVLVDLPERGVQMPATNVDTFVQRTLHYVFLRHPDPAVAETMAKTAASVIGNEVGFDLNFRTERVEALRGKPLAGVKIETYCAGLLLLCGQETGLAREQFFPIPERAAGGRTSENLAKLGMAIGDDFISPTGALFSPLFAVAGRREPMYDPQREVEEAIYDHFAQSLAAKVLVPSTDWAQTLRLKLAEASRHNPLLGQALAKAAGVSAEIDMVSAAKAAAVVETLDEIAYGNSGEYLAARRAILAGPLDALAKQGTEPEQVPRIEQLRKRHADLYRRWTQRKLTPRDLRISLVKFYIQQGRRQLDRRFFNADPAGGAGGK